MYTSKAFWIDLIERAISTAAETAIGLITVSATIESLDWRTIAGVVATATVVAVLKAFIKAPKEN